jgi:hypothetical protein
MAHRAESTELTPIPPDGTPTLLPRPATAVIVLRQTPNAAFGRGMFQGHPQQRTHPPGLWSHRWPLPDLVRWARPRAVPDHAGLASEYISQLAGSAPTKNQAIAALRHLFDALLQRHAVAPQPVQSVRGTKYSVTEGKTAELAIEQARKLFRSIDTNHAVGLRDRARSSTCWPTRVSVSAPWPDCAWPIIGTWVITTCCASGKRRQGPGDPGASPPCGLVQRIHQRSWHRP